MRQLLTIALSALMLSGCMAGWKSNRTGARWTIDGAAREPTNTRPASAPYPGSRLQPWVKL